MSARNLLFLLPALVAVLGLSSCDSRRQVDKATEEGILLLGNKSEPTTMDPQLATWVSEGNIMRALFEGLVNDHPSEDGVSIPGAAVKWEPNEDFTVWTFHLRPRATWSDGVPVTAQDFVYSYKRMLSPAFAADYASMLYYIKGAEAYNKAEPGTVDFSTVGVTALNDLTLQVTLRSPIPFLPEITKHPTWFPVPRHVIEEYGEMTDRFTDWTKPGNLIGNGPFILKSRRLTQMVAVEKNPRYWDADTVSLNGIHFFPVINGYTEARMFRDGLLHKTYTLPAEAIEAAKKDMPDQLRIQPYIGTRFLRLNTNKKLLNNRDFRKALAYAIDRSLLVEKVTQAGEKPAFGMVPPFGTYETPVGVGFDPEKARDFLKKANVGERGNFPELTLITNNSETARRNAETYQGMWDKHLGLKVRIEQVDTGTHKSRERSGDYDISASGWIGDFLDPTTFLDMWRPGDGNNNTNWENPAYSDKLSAAELIADPAERINTLVQAEQVLMDDLPIIPIYWYTTKFLVDPALQNWNPLLLDHQPYKHVKLVPQDRRKN